MVGIVTNKLSDIAQPFRKRLCFLPTRMIDEAITGIPKCSDFGPLLVVSFSRHLECTTHPMEVCLALRTDCTRPLGQFP